VAIESSESRRLHVSTAPNGSRFVRFKAGGNWFVMLFLAAWLCGWGFGEVSVIRALLGLDRSSASSANDFFMLVWLVGWTIGGGFAASTLLWMLFGVETIEANLTGLTHAFRIFTFPYVRTFRVSDIRNLRREERGSQGKEGWWSSLAFDYGTRTIRILNQIDSAEAEKVIGALGDTLGTRRRE
jgi:hypothetical protein